MSHPTPAQERTFERPHRTIGIRMINGAIGQMLRCGWRGGVLDEAPILQAAEKRSGLSDFGGDHFRPGLQQLLESYEADAALNPLGRVIVRQQLIGLAVNRLNIQRDVTQYPEILEERICQPLFVVGLPRTGTTLLHKLLSQDPASRPVLTWETFWPSPPPRLETRHSDARIRRARQRLWIINHLNPQLRAVHPMAPEEPEECNWLFANTFTTPFFRVAANLIGYDRWLRSLGLTDWVPMYQEFQRMLKLLQWRVPAGHWVLKSPAHLFTLDALWAVFPDACVVQTHRDPAKAIPSVCSLLAGTRSMLSDAVMPQRLGPQVAEMFADLLSRGMAARERTPARVFDLHYRELVADPIGAVSRIYEHFGWRFDAGLAERMRQWHSANGRGKHPTHHYNLQQFGLDEATIRTLFGDYSRRFAIAAEVTAPA